jgi:hypothetical protein
MLRSGRPSAACPRCGVDPAPHSQDLLDGHARTELALLRDRHARQVNSEPR